MSGESVYGGEFMIVWFVRNIKHCSTVLSTGIDTGNTKVTPAFALTALPDSMYPLRRLRKNSEKHIWKDYEELVDDTRYPPKYQKMYKRRNQAIEQDLCRKPRKKHAMRYTQYRGLAQVTNWDKLKVGAMNLKKLARYGRRWFCPPFIRYFARHMTGTRFMNQAWTGSLDRLTPAFDQRRVYDVR